MPRNELEIILRLKDEATRGLEQAKRALQKLEGELDRAGVKARSFSRALRDAEPASQRFAMGLGAAAATLTAFGVKALSVRGQFEQMEIGFATMLGSAEKAKRFLEDLYDFAAKTPFEIEGLQSQVQLLLALGFRAEEVIPTLRAVGDAVAALGGNAGLLNRIVLALGQMRAKGKVSAEEMRQLAEAGIPAWELLAKKIGVDIPTAMKMAENGAIDAATGMQAIIEGMNQRFRGMMEKQSTTILGIWSNIQDNMTRTLNAIGKALDETFNVREGMLAFLEWLDKVRAWAEDDGIRRAFEDYQTLLIDIAGAITGMLIPAIVSLGRAIFGLIARLGPWAALGWGIVTALEALNIISVKVGKSTTRLAEDIERAQKAFSRAKDAKEFTDALKKASDLLGPEYRRQWDLYIAKVEKGADKLTDFKKAAQEAAQELRNLALAQAQAEVAQAEALVKAKLDQVIRGLPKDLQEGFRKAALSGTLDQFYQEQAARLRQTVGKAAGSEELLRSLQDAVRIGRALLATKGKEHADEYAKNFIKRLPPEMQKGFLEALRQGSQAFEAWARKTQDAVARSLAGAEGPRPLATTLNALGNAYASVLPLVEKLAEAEKRLKALQDALEESSKKAAQASEDQANKDKKKAEQKQDLAKAIEAEQQALEYLDAAYRAGIITAKQYRDQLDDIVNTTYMLIQTHKTNRQNLPALVDLWEQAKKALEKLDETAGSTTQTLDALSETLPPGARRWEQWADSLVNATQKLADLKREADLEVFRKIEQGLREQSRIERGMRQADLIERMFSVDENRINAAIAKVENAWRTRLARARWQGMTTAIMDSASRALARVFDLTAPGFADYGDAIGNQLGKNAVESFRRWKNKIAQSLEDLAKKAGRLTPDEQSRRKAAQDIQDYAKGLEAAKDRIQSIRELIGNTKPWETQIRELEKLRKKYPQLADQIDELIAKLRELQKEGEQQGDWVTTFTTKARQGFSAARNVFDSFSSKTIGQGISQFAEGIGSIIDMFLPGVGEVVSLVGDVIGALWDGISGMFDSGAAKVTERFRQAAKGMTLISAKVFEAAREQYEEQYLFGLIRTTKERVNEAMFQTIQTIAQALDSGVTSALRSAMRKFLEGAQDWYDSLREGIREAIENAVIEAMIQGAVFKGVIGDLLDQLTENIAKGAWDAARENIRQIAQAMPEVAKIMERGLGEWKRALDRYFPRSGQDTSGNQTASITYQLPTAPIMAAPNWVNEMGRHVDRFGGAVTQFADAVARGLKIQIADQNGRPLTELAWDVRGVSA